MPIQDLGTKMSTFKKKIIVREAKPCAWTVKPDVFFLKKENGVRKKIESATKMGPKSLHY